MKAFKFKPASFFAYLMIASIMLASCSKIMDEITSIGPASYAPTEPPAPSLDSDITISFPAAIMKVFHNGAEVGVEEGDKKTAILKAGSSSEISIRYIIEADKTVYNVVVEENIGGGGK